MNNIGSTGYFINESGASSSSSSMIHYWEPHTSSIDFCETNYLLTGYIVEPHNTFSSLWGLSLFGIIGILYGNPTKELRFYVVYSILIVIGVGSAALHATLHWIFQSSDELPMIYFVISAVYCILEVDAPLKKLKYPHLPYYLLLLCCLNTIIYFKFQRVYIIFLATFTVMITLALSLHVQLAWKHRKRIVSSSSSSSNDNDNNVNSNSKLALRFYYWHYITFVIIATPIWILDQLKCQELSFLYDSLPFPLKGCTLHVVWHACAGLGAHTILQFILISRLDILGERCKLQRVVCGLIPVAVLEGKDGGEKLGGSIDISNGTRDD